MLKKGSRTQDTSQSLKPLCLVSFCIKRIGFHCWRGCNWISPWKGVVIRFLSRSTSFVPGKKTGKRPWIFFPLAGKVAQPNLQRLVWKAWAKRAMRMSAPPSPPLMDQWVRCPSGRGWKAGPVTAKDGLIFGRKHRTFLWMKPSASWFHCLLVPWNFDLLEKGRHLEHHSPSRLRSELNTNKQYIFGPVVRFKFLFVLVPFQKFKLE